MDRNWQDIDERETISASLSARRAWIEIDMFFLLVGCIMSLSARRAWIEIQRVLLEARFLRRRSPQGERG